MKTTMVLGITILLFLAIFGCAQQESTQTSGGGIPDTTSKSTWSSAKPFGLTDWTRFGSLITFSVKNNSSEDLTLNTLKLTSNASTQVRKLVKAGETIKVTVSGVEYCPSKTKYVFAKNEIVILYDSTDIPGLEEMGVADIVGTC